MRILEGFFDQVHAFFNTLPERSLEFVLVLAEGEEFISDVQSREYGDAHRVHLPGCIRNCSHFLVHERGELPKIGFITVCLHVISLVENFDFHGRVSRAGDRHFPARQRRTQDHL